MGLYASLDQSYSRKVFIMPRYFMSSQSSLLAGGPGPIRNAAGGTHCALCSTNGRSGPSERKKRSTPRLIFFYPLSTVWINKFNICSASLTGIRHHAALFSLYDMRKRCILLLRSSDRVLGPSTVSRYFSSTL